MGKKTCPRWLACLRYPFKRLSSPFNANITGWCGPPSWPQNRKSLLILVFPNDAEEFSMFPLSFCSRTSFFKSSNESPAGLGSPAGNGEPGQFGFLETHISLGQVIGRNTKLNPRGVCLFAPVSLTDSGHRCGVFALPQRSPRNQTCGQPCVTFLLAFPTNKALFSAHTRLFFQLLSI